LILLLQTKGFNAITISEIAQTAGVTEALIYKYFNDKRDLLHQILEEYNVGFLSQLELDLKGIDGALNKLRKLIWSTINCYATNKVYARILLLEARSSPGYFKSQAYQGIKRYGQIVLKVIEEGRRRGEIRADIPASSIRQIVLGGIEHLCHPGVLFDREISSDILTENLCKALFGGIRAQGQA
jgi:AcrR family transcriptional regulator